MTLMTVSRDPLHHSIADRVEARFEGGSQQMSGAIFLTKTDKVRGVMLYRDRYPHQAVDLRISTLNENSNLDWDEARAYVYFEGADAKLDHPFAYRCNVTKNS
jgi:hypothetical protein